MAQNRPEKYDTLYTQEIGLYQSSFDHPELLKTLVSESYILDSGATNSVTWEVWNNCYIISYNEKEKREIKHHTP